MSFDQGGGSPVIIDGSTGEGGGQMLRTALAFSAITGKPTIISRIRANRPKPGLAPQHLTGLDLLTRICGAEVDGADPGSNRIVFEPGQILHGDHNIDVGTAGSITLVLQTVLPALASVEGKSEITLTGGTDVKWSPPVDYYNQVLFPLLARMGLECRLELETRGYYPKGGGRAVCTVESKGRLLPLELGPFGEMKGLQGIINLTGLPGEIGERIGSVVLDHFPEAIIMMDQRGQGPSQGVGIVLAAVDGQTIMGADSLGERGWPAEKVAKGVVNSLLANMNARASVDLFTSDQLLPYLALGGGKYISRELTGHAETNVKIINMFVEKKLAIQGDGPTTFSRT